MTPTKKRILALLETTPLCPRTASEKAFTSPRNASALLAELYAEGKGLPELMRMTGRSQNAVRDALLRQGVKMREPGRPSKKG